MAVAWNLREPEIACVLVGASRPSQLVDDVKTLNKLSFTPAELAAIDRVLAEKWYQKFQAIKVVLGFLL